MLTVNRQLGVVLIGALLSMGLWGIGTAQVVYYYDVRTFQLRSA